MLIVYTAAIGETDAVQAPAVIDPTVRYVCFSDVEPPAPYEWIRVPTAADGTPPSRVFKVRADHPILTEADLTVWHDASYRLLTDLAWARQALQSADVVGMAHPRRTLIEEEAQRIARYGYVTSADASRLVQEYRRDGYKGERITSAGLLGRRGMPDVQIFNQRWWAQIRRWGYRDQVSLDYAAWTTGVAVSHLPGQIRENAYAAWRMPAKAVA